MGLRWSARRGHINSLLPTLRRVIGQIKRNCYDYKIGLTVNPQQRWYAHSRDGWDEMLVIYETRSPKSVATAEDILIESNYDDSYFSQCVNRIRGGGGLRQGYDRYYIYVVYS